MQYKQFNCILVSETDRQQLELLLSEISSDLKTVAGTNASITKWSRAQSNIQTNWENLRPVLFAAKLAAMSNKSSRQCQACHDDNAVLKCYQCAQLLCSGCDRQTHIQTPLHDRVTWVMGTHQPLTPTQIINKDGKEFSICQEGNL
jgi:hypothetical protein